MASEKNFSKQKKKNTSNSSKKTEDYKTTRTRRPTEVHKHTSARKVENNKKSVGINKSTCKNRKKRKRSKSIGVKVAIGIFFTLLLVLIIGATYFVNSVNKMNRIELDKENLGVADHDELKQYDEYDKIKNIILFGTDVINEEQNGRSDSMMLLSIDPIHNKIKVTSFMRDSYVAIDGYGEDKLNHAYAYGGPELAIKTINENFGLNIKDFATVNFSTLPQIIDLLGGVEINITPEEFEDVNQVIKWDNNEYNKSTPQIENVGLQTLSGDQALAYSRNRSSAGGDFARTQRQRTVISALFQKGIKTPVTKYSTILNGVLPLITTNMSSSDILSVAKTLVSVGNGELEQKRFPLDDYSQGGFINDIWYLLYDRDTTRQQVQDYIFDDITP